MQPRQPPDGVAGQREGDQRRGVEAVRPPTVRDVARGLDEQARLRAVSPTKRWDGSRGVGLDFLDDPRHGPHGLQGDRSRSARHLTPRRADTTAVIGSALLASARGTGVPADRRPTRPAAVHGAAWIRAVRGPAHVEWLRARAVNRLARVDRDVQRDHPVGGRGDGGDAPLVGARAARGARQRWGAGAFRSATHRVWAYPALLSSADPLGRLHRGGGQLAGTPAGLGENVVDQLRDGPVTVLKGCAQDAADALTGDPRAGIEAERPARGPDVVQAFDGRVLRDPALSRGPRARELGTGSGESLGSFGRSRSTSRPEAGSGPVDDEKLAAQPFNPMPGLRAGVVELAATVRASREREGGDDNDEHHRDQHHRGHQYCGHGLDGTRQSAVGVGLAGARDLRRGACRRQRKRIFCGAASQSPGW